MKVIFEGIIGGIALFLAIIHISFLVNLLQYLATKLIKKLRIFFAKLRQIKEKKKAQDVNSF